MRKVLLCSKLLQFFWIFHISKQITSTWSGCSDITENFWPKIIKWIKFSHARKISIIHAITSAFIHLFMRHTFLHSWFIMKKRRRDQNNSLQFNVFINKLTINPRNILIYIYICNNCYLWYDKFVNVYKSFAYLKIMWTNKNSYLFVRKNWTKA